MSKIIAQPYANIRSVPVISPGTDVGDLMPGQIVNIIEVKGDWSRVKITLQHGGNFMGWVLSSLIVDDAPPVVVPPPPPPVVNHRAGTFISMHDFPDASFWIDPNKRGWVLETVKFGENVNMAAFTDHRARGGKVCLRVCWDYGDTYPSDPADLNRFANWVDATMTFAGSQIDAVQCFNEICIEKENPNVAEHANAHTVIAQRIRERAPHALIAAAPMGWMMPVNGLHPREYFRALMQAIKPEHRTLYISHAYSHGANGNPDQMFTDDPLTGTFYNERNIEQQLAEINAFTPGIPALVGEWNYGAPERAGEPDAWQNDDGGKTSRMIEYFRGIPQVIGVCAFRWKNDTIHGRSYGIVGRNQVIDQMKRAQA